MFKETIPDVKIAQSKISGDKYLVSFIGTFDNVPTIIKFYMHEKNGKIFVKDPANYIQIYKDKKLVNRDYAFIVFWNDYYITTGKPYPDSIEKDMEKLQNAFKLLLIIYDDFDRQNIDQDYYESMMENSKFAKALYDKICDGTLSVSKFNELTGSDFTDEDFESIRSSHMTEEEFIEAYKTHFSSEINYNKNGSDYESLGEESLQSTNDSNDTNILQDINVATHGDLYMDGPTNTQDGKINAIKNSMLQGSDVTIGNKFDSYFDTTTYSYMSENTENLNYLISVKGTRKGSTYNIQISASYKYNKVYIGDCEKDTQSVDPQIMINTIYSK
ncbi:hypothetical protein [Clostridium kluyveri]|uniref:Uncharacterized protein n=1 Tax=Clostridium kluyveri TaxID=1534 RepID=A0A1L5FBH5_CLOKL|nr:hypothetical protein [Clostridium kluyveri]APM40170.1 hypothetical protein BS101_16190 [Clostridium kluyveri]